jgi:hypothetical protein
MVREALEDMAARDWQRLKLKLHPYVHWTEADGTQIRGRTKLLDLLSSTESVGPPSSYEIRDGQLYRWIA